MVDSYNRRSLVALTEETTDENSTEHSIVIGHCLRQEAAVRSDVLSGIGDTEGLATLPGLLSPEDIQLWQAACVVECHLSTTELVTVAKVRSASQVHIQFVLGCCKTCTPDSTSAALRYCEQMRSHDS